jgi:hypothetical protein
MVVRNQIQEEVGLSTDKREKSFKIKLTTLLSKTLDSLCFKGNLKIKNNFKYLNQSKPNIN